MAWKNPLLPIQELLNIFNYFFLLHKTSFSKVDFNSEILGKTELGWLGLATARSWGTVATSEVPFS